MKKLIQVPERWNAENPAATVNLSMRGVETLIAMLAILEPLGGDDEDEIRHAKDEMVKRVQEWGVLECLSKQAELDTLAEGIKLLQRTLLEITQYLIAKGDFEKPGIEECLEHESEKYERIKRGA